MQVAHLAVDSQRPLWVLGFGDAYLECHHFKDPTNWCLYQAVIEFKTLAAPTFAEAPDSETLSQDAAEVGPDARHAAAAKVWEQDSIPGAKPRAC